MFGFLAPGKRIPEWRRHYARVCQYQRKLFGLTSLPFLSYEATFLYQLAVDHGLIVALPETAAECCRLRQLPTSDVGQDEAAASFAAAFGLLLAGVKLQDDVRDSGRWYNRLLLWKYQKQINQACGVIESAAPGILQNIQTAIAEHSTLESDGTAASIEQYSKPTGDGFAAVFAGFLRCFESTSDAGAPDKFAMIGEQVGRAIIAWDCAVDFEKDRIRGEFNPLENDGDVQKAFDACLLSLARIGWLLPNGSSSQDVIAGVVARVRARRCRKPSTAPTRLLERWGLVREKGFAYAGCDGCEALCAIGECCQCLGGAGEAATGCAECFVCSETPTACCAIPCDCCIACPSCNDGDDLCSSKKKADKKIQKETAADRASQPSGPYSEYIDSTGTADTNLNPSGFVVLNDNRIPAKSASVGYIDAGTLVRVVRCDPFGVHVVEE